MPPKQQPKKTSKKSGGKRPARFGQSVSIPSNPPAISQIRWNSACLSTEALFDYEVSNPEAKPIKFSMAGPSQAGFASGIAPILIEQLGLPSTTPLETLLIRLKKVQIWGSTYLDAIGANIVDPRAIVNSGPSSRVPRSANILEDSASKTTFPKLAFKYFPVPIRGNDPMILFILSARKGNPADQTSGTTVRLHVSWRFEGTLTPARWKSLALDPLLDEASSDDDE